MKNSRNNNYPLCENFYNFQIEENEKNPKDISKIKSSNENDGKRNEKNIYCWFDRQRLRRFRFRTG